MMPPKSVDEELMDRRDFLTITIPFASSISNNAIASGTCVGVQVLATIYYYDDVHTEH